MREEHIKNVARKNYTFCAPAYPFIALMILMLSFSSNAAEYHYSSEKSVLEGWELSPYTNPSAQLYLSRDSNSRVPVLFFDGKLSIDFRNQSVWNATYSDDPKAELPNQYSVSWTMKTSHAYSYAFHIATNEGIRIVEYVESVRKTPVGIHSIAQVKLADAAKTNRWVRIRRNLWNDFNHHFPHLRPISVLSVEIKGSGLLNELFVENTVSPNFAQTTHQELTEFDTQNSVTHSTDTISQNSKNSDHSLTQSGVEQGVSTALRTPQHTSLSDVGKEASQWSVTTYALSSRTARRGSDEAAVDRSGAGLSAKYELGNRLFALMDVKPDHSTLTQTIESNSPSNSDDEKIDNRPFFLQNQEDFGSDENYFSSLKLPNMDFGVKTFANTGNAHFSLLATQSPQDRSDAHLQAIYRFSTNNRFTVDFVSSEKNDASHRLFGSTLEQTFSNNLFYVLKASSVSNKDAINKGDASIEPEEKNTANGGSATVGWSSSPLSMSITADSYGENYQATNSNLDPNVSGSQGVEIDFSVYNPGFDFIKHVNTQLSISQRNSLNKTTQKLGAFVGLSAQISDFARVAVEYSDYEYAAAATTIESADLNAASEPSKLTDAFWNASVDLNIASSKFGYGFSVSDGVLSSAEYQYASFYSWFSPLNSVSVSLFAENLKSFGTYQQQSVEATWNINRKQSLFGKYSSGNDYKSWKVAYTQQFFKQAEVVLAYQKLVDANDEIVGKLSWTFR